MWVFAFLLGIFIGTRHLGVRKLEQVRGNVGKGYNGKREKDGRGVCTWRRAVRSSEGN